MTMKLTVTSPNPDYVTVVRQLFGECELIKTEDLIYALTTHIWGKGRGYVRLREAKEQAAAELLAMSDVGMIDVVPIMEICSWAGDPSETGSPE